MDQALTDDEALALGHIDLATYLGGRSSQGVEQEDPSATEVDGNQVQAAEEVFWNYGWATLNSGGGFDKGAWAWTIGIHDTGNRTIRMHGVRGTPNGNNWGGRCFYKLGTATYWSRWRMNNAGHPWITWAAFDRDVIASRAQLGYGW